MGISKLSGRACGVYNEWGESVVFDRKGLS